MWAQILSSVASAAVSTISKKSGTGSNTGIVNDPSKRWADAASAARSITSNSRASQDAMQRPGKAIAATQFPGLDNEIRQLMGTHMARTAAQASKGMSSPSSSGVEHRKSKLA